jgi:hypothetical protein
MERNNDGIFRHGLMILLWLGFLDRGTCNFRDRILVGGGWQVSERPQKKPCRWCCIDRLSPPGLFRRFS